MPSIYLAGPSVFWPDAEAEGGRLKAICDGHGLTGLYPADGDFEAWQDIYEANCRLIEKADAVVADITPFRGPHADDGTAWEIGHAHALQKPVFCYGEIRPIVERIPHEEQDGVRRDAAGLMVEDFGLPVNLMLAGAAEGLFSDAEGAIEAAAEFLAKA